MFIETEEFFDLLHAIGIPAYRDRTTNQLVNCPDWAYGMGRKILEAGFRRIKE